MANQIIRNMIRARIKGAIAKFHATSDITHNGVKGSAREIFFEELLSPLLPINTAVGTGIIVDPYEQQSGQLDLIIYDKASVPSIMLDEKLGYFPREACHYAFEVKSCLTSTEIDKVIKTFKSTSNLKSGPEQPIHPRELINTLFAYSSDLKGSPEDEINRILNKFSSFDEDTNIHVICVIGKGYWFLLNQEKELLYANTFKNFPRLHVKRSSQQSYFFMPATKDYDEVTKLLAGICNTIFKNSKLRIPGNFGNYIMDSNEDLKLLMKNLEKTDPVKE